MAVWVGALWLGAGVVMAAIGWLGGDGRLKGDRWGGSRWLAGGGGLVAAIGALMMIFGPDDATSQVISIVLGIFMIATVIGAYAVGDRLAKRATQPGSR